MAFMYSNIPGHNGNVAVLICEVVALYVEFLSKEMSLRPCRIMLKSFDLKGHMYQVLRGIKCDVT